MNLYQLDGSISVPEARAKVREEFERNRFVQQLPVVDVLLAKSAMEYQEMMNYWKQLPHVMKWVVLGGREREHGLTVLVRYFRAQEDEKATIPNTFMAGFLEVRVVSVAWGGLLMEDESGPQLAIPFRGGPYCRYEQVADWRLYILSER